MQAEAEEAERQARVSLEIKKSLTHILLSVTDSLFGMPPPLQVWLRHVLSFVVCFPLAD